VARVADTLGIDVAIALDSEAEKLLTFG
jgi:hypothetical protein